MISAEFLILLSIYLLHAISLIILIPSKYSLIKTTIIWGIATFINTATAYQLVKLYTEKFSLYNGLVITFVFCFTAVFVVSAEIPSKTLFLFLTYVQLFMTAVFFARFLSHYLFLDDYFALVAIRSSFHILIVILCFTVKKPFNQISREIKKGWWPLNLVTFLFFAYLSIIMPLIYSSDFDIHIIGSFVLLLFIVVAIHLVFFHSIRYMRTEAIGKQIEMHNSFLLKQAESMQEALKYNHRMQHDSKHHRLIIREMAEAGNLEALLKYLDSYDYEEWKHRKKVICENSTADSILTAYERKAKLNGITTNFDVTLEKNCGIHDLDIVAILGNLMENAVNACILSGEVEPQIEVYVGRVLNKIAIRVSNSCASNPICENEMPENDDRDGIGILSILNCVEKYEGETDFQYTDNIFTCRIVLKTDKTNTEYPEIIS